MRAIIHDFFSYNDRVMRSVAHELEAALPLQDLELIRIVSAEAESKGFPLYIVGGLPRDLVLGRPPSDYDLVVEGSAIDLAQGLVLKHGGHLTLHSRFGTAKWRIPLPRNAAVEAALPSRPAARRSEIDLISARSEIYPEPAHLPRVKLGTIEQDLQRRDFTMNALALRLDGVHYGELLDPLGAVECIRRQEISVLHERSFEDDPTRMYRAVRYEQRLDFKITSETLHLIPTASKWIPRVTGHRLRQELDQVLGEERAARMIARLAALRLLKPIHDALPGDRATVRRIAIPRRLPQPQADSGRVRDRMRNWLMWLMMLSPPQIRSIRQRLGLDNRRTAEVLATSELRRTVSRLTRLRPSGLTHHLEKFPLSAVEAVCDALPAGISRHRLTSYLRTWRHVRPRATGRDLRQLGLPPGPAYHQILQSLRSAWIDHTISSAAEERRLLEKSVARLRRNSARLTRRA